MYNTTESRLPNTTHSCCDLDLGPTMHNIEFVQVIFIYYKVFEFHVPRSMSFLVILQKHTHIRTHKKTLTSTLWLRFAKTQLYLTKPL